MKSFLTLLCGVALGTLSVLGAGRQLTGVYAPASTPPLPPEEAARKFTLPEGFEMRIFASEPQVVNPVAMTWDDRGRLWVVELLEYPLGAPAGSKPRDNVKILEDTDNDGRADKVTIFKDGLNLATGILLGYGGVFVGQAPHLLFYEDTNGDDIADKETIVKSGFGLEDRHELLNGFTWGPDGHLYMTHGVFTYSKVKDPSDPEDDGVLMTAAVARYHPRTRQFEIFAEGTSNPWGVDFDAAGNAFVSACVIDHLFHMAPGGIYQRQAGSPPFPYAYDLLPSIVDHKHFRAAYAGIQVYQGDMFPEEYKGTVFMGNIHDNSVHQDKLTSKGASFTASFTKDIIRANDGWFRPVSLQTGPDGALWVMDWYDKYPCYQNANADPEGVDRAHGRIWRLLYTGQEKGKPVPSHPQGLNLGKASGEALAQTLAHPNAWHRRMAQRILSERGDTTFGRSLHGATPVHKMFDSGPTTDARLAALWTLHGAGMMDEGILNKAAQDKEAVIRAWAARLTGERGYPLESAINRLHKLGEDPDITVRSAVATAARQFVSGSLTINTPPKVPVKEVVTGPPLSSMWFATKGQHDPLFSFQYWMAIEPIVAYDPIHALGFYEEDGGMPGLPFSGIIFSKIMRRICDLNEPETLNRAILSIGKIKETNAPTVVAALNGLIEGMKGKNIVPSQEALATIAHFASFKNREVVARAQQLGTIWGDTSALQASIKVFQDPSRSLEDRLRAIQSSRQQKIPAVREAFLALIGGNHPDSIKQAAISGLSEVGGDEVGEIILRQWKDLSSATRRSAAEVLSSRRRWAQPFLTALENKTIGIDEIPVPVIRSLIGSKDDYVKNRAATVIGKFRETNPDKAKLIAEKKQVVLKGPVDLKKGHELAQKTCFTCHKLYGEGGEVGPDLTGVGRSSLDALLANVIDPNQIIGLGYENVEIETNDDRVIAGRQVESTDSHVKLLSAGPKEEIISRKDIKSIRVSEMSVMPEGLEQMPDEDFRNLISYILNPPQDKQ